MNRLALYDSRVRSISAGNNQYARLIAVPAHCQTQFGGVIRLRATHDSSDAVSSVVAYSRSASTKAGGCVSAINGCSRNERSLRRRRADRSCWASVVTNPYIPVNSERNHRSVPTAGLAHGRMPKSPRPQHRRIRFDRRHQQTRATNYLRPRLPNHPAAEPTNPYTL